MTSEALRQLKFRQLPCTYAIVRLPPNAPVPDWATRGDFNSITRTAAELSIVCPAANIPKDIDRGLPWICFKLDGPSSFSQTGILLSFIEPLSENSVPILAISTYDTDYVLVQAECMGRAVDLLRKAGHELVAGESSGS